MAKKKDDFDVQTFFIYVMLLLTVIVGGFAALNQRKVNDTKTQITRQIRFLDEMTTFARDEEFRTWVAKDREGSATQSNLTSNDFQALYVKLAREPQHRLNLENHTMESEIPHPGGVELPFRLIVKKCRLEQLTKFLVAIEERWPGARVKKFDKMQFLDKDDQKGWDVTVVLSIFRPDV